MASQGLHPTIRDYFTAFIASLDYCRPYWEQYARLYEFFRNKRFDALSATYSKINMAYGYSAIADRVPKIYNNVFSTPDHVSLVAYDPEAEISADAATAWIRHLLACDIKIEQSIVPTLVSSLIGGTAYRMPYLTMKKAGEGRWEPRLGGRDIEFFHVLPCPGSGHGNVNPLDKEQEDAVPWVMVIDWESEPKIKAMAERGIYNKEQVGKMLDRRGQEVYLEDQYRNRWAVVGNLTYSGPSMWRARQNAIDDNSHRRRVTHWFRRDKHVIVGEDVFLLYEGPPVFEDGTIPLAKYTPLPDLNNWFGIPYLSLLEDLLKSQIMSFNFRKDREIASLFPTTWIRQDIAEFARNKGSDLRPKPYDVRFFPATVKNISEAIWYDRMPDVPEHAFMSEDYTKAAIQKIAGQTETTQSLGDVVGNKTATGVTSILSELAARPNMESLAFEHGFRDEIALYLAYGQKFINDPVFIRDARQVDGFPWAVVTPDQIAQRYHVETHGTRWMAESNTNYQKLLAYYPYFSQAPNWNRYELDKFTAKTAGMPDSVIQRALMQVNPMAPPMPPEGGEVGGMASSQDIGQQIRSVNERTGVPGEA